MQVGMLWFDDDPRRKFDDKVARAVGHYKEKYGQSPTLCLVNPGALNGGPAHVAGVQIKSARSVLPNHFWIGLGRSPLGTIAAPLTVEDAALRRGAIVAPARLKGPTRKR